MPIKILLFIKIRQFSFLVLFYTCRSNFNFHRNFKVKVSKTTFVWWLVHVLFSKKKYCLINLFFDEFEVTNPLGSKPSSHKMGAIYFTIGNLPPQLNSKLCHIHLFALFYSQDQKSFGFNSILEPIVQRNNRATVRRTSVSHDFCSVS